MDDWDRKPKESASVYISLKSQGETAKVRIGAAPLRFVTVWPAGAQKGAKPLDEAMVANFSSGQWMSIMRSPDWEIRETYVLLVIDRMDGNAKVFKVSGTVYGKIRDYAKNPEWGAPAGYDITVTRTETPGKAYWDVTPSPKTPILTSEVDKVRALDVAKLVPTALPANVPQPDEIDEITAPEPLPWEQHVPVATPSFQQAAPAPAIDPAPAAPFVPDDVIEDIGDGPINLDDIPF